MDDPTVRISTRIGAHESARLVIDSIKNLFPGFIPDTEIIDSEFPKKNTWVDLHGDGGPLDRFLQALRDQRILDTGMDAMTMDSTENTTLFRLSRQACLVNKVGFVLEGESTFGGHIEVLLESKNIISWIENATFHEGRKYVPRSVGDGYGMEMDGESKEWND